MNNRYLFRAKRYSGKWVEGYFVCNTHGDAAIIPEKSNTRYSVDPATLGQCTGLRDKNGKLIFEGDILQEDRHPNPFIFRVDWINGNGAFMLCMRDSNNKIIGCCGMEMSYDMRIIGNIYDNPDLLEVSE